MSPENQTLHLDYEVSLEQYRQIWFDLFKQGLPNALAFWGTGILLGIIATIFLPRTRNELIVALLLLGFLIVFVLYSIYAGYQNFMKRAKKIFDGLKESHKSVSLIFNPDSDGFESINGKNFSHIAWESVKSVKEKNQYFIFQMSAGAMFYIPKTAFGNEARTDFFRALLKTNLGDKTNLLNE
jgi:YcxB-like protein